MKEIRPIIWEGDVLKLLDQRLLPKKERYLDCTTAGQLRDCIKQMVVRGAPAIGVSAAFGLVLAAREYLEHQNITAEDDRFSWESFRQAMDKTGAELTSSRPTAVNLSWAVERMLRKVSTLKGKTAGTVQQELESEAQAIYAEDIETNHKIGEYGAEIIAEGSTLLTHCNAGALATAGYGTALGVIRSAFRQGKVYNVLADETRPLLQGSRLTCWELQKEGIPVQIIADSAAGYFINRGEVDAVITGADRIAANGDAANKIGTYSLALLARENNVPFYVAAPVSTVDLSIESGEEIVIEERDESEVLDLESNMLTPEGATARNPAFDVTPARFITALITEKGVIFCPNEKIIRRECSSGVE